MARSRHGHDARQPSSGTPATDPTAALTQSADGRLERKCGNPSAINLSDDHHYHRQDGQGDRLNGSRETR